MKRRSFVKSSVVGGAMAAVMPSLSNAMTSLEKEKQQQYYELRIYSLKDEAQQKLVENYFRDAAIPVLNRMGVKHVGVFTEMKPDGQTKIYALIAYDSLAQFNAISNSFEEDPELQRKGSAYLNAPATSPAYERIESSLLKAFEHFPTLTAPEKKERILELRQYQSATEAAGKKKIEMFNDRGEIDIFKRLDFNPVFWGETVIGPQRPNLTYMLTFKDLADKSSHWQDFGNDTQWHEISAVPEYADALLVSKITSTLLVPAAFSQI
ncbi:MAG TPA: NIPSNAP family protein [Mucilaginibacter sp.]|nr:NIPSNAP family protein [Mucilaginibacter sp.]